MDDLTKIQTGLNSGNDEEVKKAFDLFYRRASPSVYKNALRYLRSAQSAKDIVQDVFADLWTNRAKLRGVSDILAYLSEATWHKCLTAWRQKSSERRRLNEYLRRQENYSVSKEYLTYAVLEENSLDKALSTLDSSQRLLLDLKYKDGLGYREIGTRLGKRANTVAKDVQRIRNGLYIIISKMP